MNGIILAGGNNSRISNNKAFEKINGKTIIEREIEVLECVSSEIFIVANKVEKFKQLKIKIVPDIYKGKGSLGGIYTGLLNSDSEYNFIIGCDMPFLNRDLIEYMEMETKGYDMAIPCFGKYTEPLHAVYSKKCIPLIKHQMLEGNLAVRSFFPQAKIRYITEDEINKFDKEKLSFFNVNTAEDLKKALTLTPAPTL